MKRQPRILAGTALGLLMASAPLGAFPLPSGEAFDYSQLVKNAPLILAQAECPEGDRAAPETQQPRRKRPRPSQSPKQRLNLKRSPRQRLNLKPQPEAAPEPEAQPEAAPEPEAQPEAAAPEARGSA